MDHPDEYKPTMPRSEAMRLFAQEASRRAAGDVEKWLAAHPGTTYADVPHELEKRANDAWAEYCDRARDARLEREANQ